MSSETIFHLDPFLTRIGFLPIRPFDSILDQFLFFYPMQMSIVFYAIWKTGSIEMVDFMLKNAGCVAVEFFLELISLSIVGAYENTGRTRHKTANSGSGKAPFSPEESLFRSPNDFWIDVGFDLGHILFGVFGENSCGS